MDKKSAFVLWFDELGIEDVPLVGGKNASLGEMYRLLTPKGVKIPNGFAITATSYFYLIEKTGIKDKIKNILSDLDTGKIRNLQSHGDRIRKLIRTAKMPPELEKEILESYRSLSKHYRTNAVDVAVRSSATAEDLPDASFAGQQETYLNIHSEKQLIRACMDCFASLFTDRAISYRQDKGFDHFSIGLSIAVQKMVRSDLACSGVMFSIDTESGFEDAVFVTGSYGLGENIVQGAVNPDEYYVFKPTLKQGKNAIISKTVGEKKIKMIYTKSFSNPVKNVSVPEKEREKFVLDEKEILTLAKWAVIIEEHYSEKAGHFKPMDMEWAKDGRSGDLFIVQARPETVHSQEKKNVLHKYKLLEKSDAFAAGRSVGEKIGVGKSHVIKNVKDINKFKPGEVLVTEMTDPDWEPIMKIASAIVTDKGGRTCHAAIISRELGIPCIVGTLNGSRKIPTGQDVTVDCSSGSEGVIYKGKLDFKIQETNLAKLPDPKTKVMMNIGNPEQAFEFSSLPVKGVGLAREEFIINSYIQIHPLALLNYNKMKESPLKKQIAKITKGYKNKADFFVDKLAYGIATIAAAFYPYDVVVRLSDFKSNEYANLIGGKDYEPKEDNPMIGWRGASRYYDDHYKEAFALECKGIKKVREEMGLTNVVVMVPFCRTVDEGKRVLKVMAENGLKQGKKGLRVYAMCEIPANVILAEEFLDVFDGFSIGSNDLTQLTLGLDRDSELVARIYDERNEAVKKLIRQVIDVAKKKKKHMGFCGDAPSSIPGYAKFLADCGIESLSVTPDAVVQTVLNLVDKKKVKKAAKAKPKKVALQKKPAAKKVAPKKSSSKLKPIKKKVTKAASKPALKKQVKSKSAAKKPAQKSKPANKSKVAKTSSKKPVKKQVKKTLPNKAKKAVPKKPAKKPALNKATKRPAKKAAAKKSKK